MNMKYLEQTKKPENQTTLHTKRTKEAPKQKNNIKSKIAFIHIPTIYNIEDMNRLLSSIKDYIETLCEEEK